MVVNSVKIKGVVTGGNHIGRTLGFPTANIEISGSLNVKDGVYAVRGVIDGKCYNGMANIGYRPTIEKLSGRKVKARLLEVTFFDFEGDLYNEELEVELVKFTREERTLNSLAELKELVEEDKAEIERFFEGSI